MRKFIFIAVLSVALLVGLYWLYVGQVVPWYEYVHALERSTWPKAMNASSLHGLPLYVRCSFDAGCRAAMAAFEHKYPLRPLDLKGLIPSGLLLLGAFIALWKIPAPRSPSLYTGGFAQLNDYRDMLTRYPNSRPGSLLLAAAPWGHSRLLGVWPGTRERPEVGHALVAAPSRAGKSVCLTANLLAYSGSVVVLDIKGELHRLTSGHRVQDSEVFVLDPSGIGNRYDPFADLGTSEEALLSAARQMMRVEEDKNPVFAERAARGVVAMARAAHLAGRPVLRFIAENIEGASPIEFVERLRVHSDTIVQKNLAAFVGLRLTTVTEEMLAADRFFASSWSLLQNRLAPLLTAGVLAMTDGNDFRAADLLRTKTTVYLRFSQAEWSSTKDVFRFLMLGLVQGILREVDGAGEQNDYEHLLLAIDEGGTAIVPGLPDFLATVAGRGVSVMLFIQSLAQLDAAYGEHGAAAILDNMHHQVYYSARGRKTAEHVSAMSGRISSADTRSNQRRTPLGHDEESQSVGQRDRPLLTPDDVRRLSINEVLVISDDRRIIRAKRLLYYKQGRMRREVEAAKSQATPVKVRKLIQPVVKPNPVAGPQAVPKPEKPSIPPEDQGYVDID
jgi:type IV secretion system protein VirD4